MSNEKVKFKGLVKWASVPPNEARKPYKINKNEPENTAYSIQIQCTTEQFNDLMKKGLSKLTELHPDEKTGMTYINVRANKVKGKHTFPDPKVVDTAGNTVTKKIGNGSECVVIAELAPNKERGGVVMRLRAVQVLKLVEYEDDNDEIDEMLETKEFAELTTDDVDDNDNNDW